MVLGIHKHSLDLIDVVQRVPDELAGARLVLTPEAELTKKAVTRQVVISHVEIFTRIDNEGTSAVLHGWDTRVLNAAEGAKRLITHRSRTRTYLIAGDTAAIRVKEERR